jgi:hypothetical protein
MIIPQLEQKLVCNFHLLMLLVDSLLDERASYVIST